MKFFRPLKYYTLVIYHYFVPNTNEIETNNQYQILKLIYMSFMLIYIYMNLLLYAFYLDTTKFVLFCYGRVHNAVRRASNLALPIP